MVLIKIIQKPPRCLPNKFFMVAVVFHWDARTLAGDGIPIASARVSFVSIINL
jgi:hypothetical protein